LDDEQLFVWSQGRVHLWIGLLCDLAASTSRVADNQQQPLRNDGLVFRSLWRDGIDGRWTSLHFRNKVKFFLDFYLKFDMTKLLIF